MTATRTPTKLRRLLIAHLCGHAWAVTDGKARRTVHYSPHTGGCQSCDCGAYHDNSGGAYCVHIRAIEAHTERECDNEELAREIEQAHGFRAVPELKAMSEGEARALDLPSPRNLAMADKYAERVLAEARQRESEANREQ